MSKVDVKCVLLGKEFGGKTSLVERYVHKRFVEKPSNKYQAKCKIYLCGTKRDLINMEPNARRISEKAVSDYACAIGAKVFETSSKTGENVEELFETVARDYVQFEMQLEGLSSNLIIVLNSSFNSTIILQELQTIS
ncbi:ras-related protein Rab-24-like protein [Dinothrombium tinctorium]|uniref:Ras-related protein Rab-24-like protein n=1 Tax=Dinothrombium tinctorium TaxID=1965070 RepID=A0A443R531_9ACAR|nr:ras-related protein Rab-24-like protein [Dinothrombium tinctorium]